MKTMLFAAVLGTSILATPALAQWTPQPAMPVPPVTPGPPSAHVGHMQADRTRQQAQQMADTMFQRFDINHDGRGGQSDEGGTRAQRMVDRMFAGAPSVTLQQFEAQALARFDRQDLNHDGVVTSAERQQRWGGGQSQ